MEKGTIVHSHPINGAFEVRSVKGKLVIGFNATLLKRFSVAVAYFIDGLWRLRYRIVTTLQSGVLCFPLCKTLQNQNGVHRIPAEYDANTALIIGIAPAGFESEVTLRGYANETGCIDNDFNGYEGSVKFNKFLDKVTFSDSLKEQQYGDRLRFDRNLYQLTSNDFEEFRCANCLVVLKNEEITIPNYRACIYGQMPVSMFTIRIENPNDELFVLDKATGFFKV